LRKVLRADPSHAQAADLMRDLSDGIARLKAAV